MESCPLSGAPPDWDPDRKPLPYWKDEFDSFQATFSPDAQWIIYASNESGRHEVYVQPFPNVRREMAHLNRRRRATPLAP
jgi:hypothetical protein